jgi:hypothetical protein
MQNLHVVVFGAMVSGERWHPVGKNPHFGCKMYQSGLDVLPITSNDDLDFYRDRRTSNEIRG